LRFLVTICVIAVSVFVFVASKRFSVFSGPLAIGDWVVTGAESYYDEVIVLNENLVFEDRRNSTVRKVTLKMNCA
jgi:cell shape-determining protein MreC